MPEALPEAVQCDVEVYLRGPPRTHIADEGGRSQDWQRHSESRTDRREGYTVGHTGEGRRRASTTIMRRGQSYCTLTIGTRMGIRRAAAENKAGKDIGRGTDGDAL